MNKKIVIFGEMLWDCFPDKNIPGGAPMNVALHTQYLGLETSFISRVGHDKLGRELVDFVQSKSLTTSLIQEDAEHETSRVLVDNTDKENIQYEIVKPVAWDYIDWHPAIQEKVDQADAFVFGSLSARSEKSRATLFKLLETPTLKILDINLRAPHYERDTLDQLLQRADILKINDDELDILIDYYQLPPSLDEAVKKLSELFTLHMVCITKGSAGAAIYDGKNLYQHPGYKVQVEDTVGSGDAFLSGFISKFLSAYSPEEILDFACALGALVATQKGGTPHYDLEAISAIRK
ncbi:carbohydrate kinase [Echinicola sediminis]